MSSIPGYTLEAFVMWDHNITVEAERDANTSLRIAEILGTTTHYRPTLTQEQFAEVMKFYDVLMPDEGTRTVRDYVEYWLGEFDEENQSWRDYAGYSFDGIPEECFKNAAEYLKQFGQDKNDG